MPTHNLSLETTHILHEKTIVPIVGISAIGKNTLMRYAANGHAEFAVSSGFTTRPPKHEGEDDYSEYLPNNDATKKALFTATGPEELVQYQIHPTSGFMYGTKRKNYSGTYNMLDTLSSAVNTFNTVGFLACLPVVVVAERHEWQTRFASNDFSKAEAAKRIAEGIQSLEWSLDQRDSVAWLVNSNDNLHTTAAKLRKIAKTGEWTPNLSAEHLGHKLLRLLKTL